jgi:branched-chain amino acid transport system substrate-binding protein
VTEPTIDSHVVKLKSSGAEAFLVAGTPKFAAQAIKKADEVGWKPLFLINFVSSSVSSTIVPAGPEKAVGIVAATITKDPNDKKWADDPGIKWYREHFAKYLPGADIGDANYLFGTQQGQILEQVLKQCGDDVSRRGAYAACRSPLSYRVLQSTRARKAVWRTRSCSCSAGTAARGINSERFSAPRKSELAF